MFGPTGLSGKLRSEIHHELCTVGIESFDRACPGETAAQPPTRAQLDRQALTQALSNVRLVDACAGGGSTNPEVTLDAPGSQACKVALARLNAHQLSILAVLAATIQASEPGFPTIDKFANGVATSIKSLDLTAPSYHQKSCAQSRPGYINKIAGFNCAQRAGERVRSLDIKGRALELAIPAGSVTAEQQAALDAARKYAAARGVSFTVVKIP